MAAIRPAAEAGITIEPNPDRVLVRVDGLTIGDSTRALVMRAPGTPDVQYLPRDDVDMARLVRTPHGTREEFNPTPQGDWVVACVDCHPSLVYTAFDCVNCHLQMDTSFFPHYNASNGDCLGCHKDGDWVSVTPP